MEKVYFDLNAPLSSGRGFRYIIMTEKKTRYTEAQKKAASKYLHETVEDVRIRVPKGQKDIIKKHAESMGESMNAFVLRAINEAMAREASEN